MGCFIACFRSSKDVKRRKQRRKVQPRDQANSISKQVQAALSTGDCVSDRPVSPILKARDKSEEQQLSLSPRKRVTFDSNVKTYEPDLVHEEVDIFLGKVREDEEEKDPVKTRQCKSYSEDSSTVSSVGSYPPNHRYRNCRDSDDEDEVLDYADSDLDQNVDSDDDGDESDIDDIEDDEYGEFSEDEDGITESSGKSSAAQAFAKEVDSRLSVCGSPGKTETPIELQRNARDRSACFHSVLKPVENLSQWKAVKAKGRLPSNPRKENLALDDEGPWSSFGSKPSFKELSFGHKSKTCQPKNSDQDIAVDASLSNWLSSSEATPISKISRSISGAPTPESQGSNSLRSQEDRPILGALTIEELKQFSTPPSPRRSPNRNPDEMPIIGTVGTYWSHSGSVENSGSASSFKRVSNTNNNYRDVRVK